MDSWHKKVEARTTQTLKFVNYSRILRIIGYDPGKYMNSQKLNVMAQGLNPDQNVLSSIIGQDKPNLGNDKQYWHQQ